MDVERRNSNSEPGMSEERDEQREADARAQEGASKEKKEEDRASRENSFSPRNDALGTSSGALDDEWSRVVAEFVDDPRRAVTRAHELLERTVQSLIENWNAQRSAIEQQWKQAGDSNTETMRICLQQYRALAQRLSMHTDPGGAREMPFPPHQDVANPVRH